MKLVESLDALLIELARALTVNQQHTEPPPQGSPVERRLRLVEKEKPT
jgi:hypothetical protein